MPMVQVRRARRNAGCSRNACARSQAVVQNQDNREHDLLDSDDYYQFEGGMTAAIEHVAGCEAQGLPQRPFAAGKACDPQLEEEIGRVVRARVVNPKWIEGVMRHGYKGASRSQQRSITCSPLLRRPAPCAIIILKPSTRPSSGRARARLHGREECPAQKELAERLIEAIERGLWTPKSNSAKFTLSEMVEGGRANV